MSRSRTGSIQAQMISVQSWPTMEVKLPNELWLSILSQSPKSQESWRALRLVNRQLKACVEQHFETQVLPRITISLPVMLPSYDARNLRRAWVIFGHDDDHDHDHDHRQKADRTVNGRACFRLSHTEPDYYRNDFLSRWRSMRADNDGWLARGIKWEMECEGHTAAVCLVTPRADFSPDEQHPTVSFMWRPTLEGFFQR